MHTTSKQFASKTHEVSGEYARERGEVGFTYFPNFKLSRQALQDSILAKWEDNITQHAEKKCTFMMGAPGSGKSTEAARIGDPIIDADWYKTELPEFHTFPRYLASGVVHREAGLLAAVAQRRAEHRGICYTIDTASSNAGWVRGEILRLRDRGYQINLVHMDTHLDVCRARCTSRNRHVPEFVISRVHADVHTTFTEVYSLFDQVRTVCT